MFLHPTCQRATSDECKSYWTSIQHATASCCCSFLSGTIAPSYVVAISIFSECGILVPWFCFSWTSAESHDTCFSIISSSAVQAFSSVIAEAKSSFATFFHFTLSEAQKVGWIQSSSSNYYFFVQKGCTTRNYSAIECCCRSSFANGIAKSGNDSN